MNSKIEDWTVVIYYNVLKYEDLESIISNIIATYKT